MNSAIISFLTNMYWIDLSAVFVILIIFLIFILWRSRKIEARNIDYNARLLELRKTIYAEYERHFVL